MDKDCQVPTSTSSPDLSAESTNEQMGTLKNLLLWLIFELFQTEESRMEENEVNGNKKCKNWEMGYF